jgi:hypothetical protein
LKNWLWKRLVDAGGGVGGGGVFTVNFCTPKIPPTDDVDLNKQKLPHKSTDVSTLWSPIGVEV